MPFPSVHFFLFAALQIQAICKSFTTNSNFPTFNDIQTKEPLGIFFIVITLLSFLFFLMAIYLIKNPINDTVRLNNKEKITLFTLVVLCLFDHLITSF
jgi:hypothetical protein